MINDSTTGILSGDEIIAKKLDNGFALLAMLVNNLFATEKHPIDYFLPKTKQEPTKQSWELQLETMKAFTNQLNGG